MKRKKKLVTSMLAAFMLFSSMPVFAQESEETVITIIGTSDIHGNLWGYSYENNSETTNDGMARLYTYIESVRAENPNTILVDCGDTIQGTILTDDLYNKSTENGEHPIIEAMNIMNFDAIALGNHEFNFEHFNLLERIEAQSNFPFLAGNVIENATGENPYASYIMLEQAGVSVAIIGMTHPDIPTWDGEKVEHLSFLPIPESVTETVNEIGDSADLIVVVAHTGLEEDYTDETGAISGYKTIDLNPEIDALLLGHLHITENETIGNTLVGAPKSSGREIVRFDFTLNADNEIVNSTIEIIDMETIEPSQEFRDLDFVKEAHEKTVSYVQDDVIGSTTAKFQPENEIVSIPAGKIMDTAVMDFINNVQLEISGADVSAAALFSNTSDLPEGDLNYGNIFDIYKFDNTLYSVEVTGAELKAYMEWSVQAINQYKEGDLHLSFDNEIPGYLYDMFAGVEYTVDITEPVGQRIKNVTFKGSELLDEQVLVLCVNDYRYSSALKSEGLVANDYFWESPNSIRDMIVEYLAVNSPITPFVDNNWSIVSGDYQLDNPVREILIDMVNNEALDSPLYNSLNLNDPEIIAIVENIAITIPEITEEVIDELEILEEEVIEEVVEEEQVIEETVEEEIFKPVIIPVVSEPVITEPVITEPVIVEPTNTNTNNYNEIKTETIVNGTVYTVQSGDSLWRIAKNHYGNGSRYVDIAITNGISNPNVISIGQKLFLQK